MKKTYSTPIVAESGDVIVETRGEDFPGEDTGNSKLAMPEGGVGFNL